MFQSLLTYEQRIGGHPNEYKTYHSTHCNNHLQVSITNHQEFNPIYEDFFYTHSNIARNENSDNRQKPHLIIISFIMTEYLSHIQKKKKHNEFVLEKAVGLIIAEITIIILHYINES